MIHLDVTSAAGTSTNGGVQRAIRGIFRYLQTSSEVQAVRWDFHAQRYARLSPREDVFLTDPFGSYVSPVGAPGFLSGVTSPGALIDHWARRSRGLPLENFLGSNDVLLIPDVCWDARIHSWPTLAQRPGRKIAIFHDAVPLRILTQEYSKQKLELFAEYIEKLAQLDLVICISREVEADLLRFWRQFGVKGKPTIVLLWPMPFIRERPLNRPNFFAKRLLYVSRLRMRKNHLILLEACEILWREGLTFSLDLLGMVCAFTDTIRILRRVAELRRRGRPVRWLKHVSEIELERAYAECSATVFPSQMEGFGFPIIESLWHRRPVICGRNGAIGEVAAGGGCRQVDQNNVADLAEAIRELITDEVTYDRLYAEAGARTFRTWDDYGRDLDEVLKPVRQYSNRKSGEGRQASLRQSKLIT